jgi:serine/threonine protein kinase/tetratricopeptide (TPR) repeat protein
MNGHRAKEIYLDAAEIAQPAQRQAFLAARCGHDDLLRKEVEELLQHHSQLGAFLKTGQQACASTADGIVEKPGAVIGPYTLRELIGEGGMGLVFVAEQTRPVRRKVALKVIKPGMDTRQVIARFEAERQALALMEHPNIAKVLDAGTTDSRTPYFVMELVKGLTLTDYCDQHRLTTRRRLELFLPVCHAVQHAHHKGVIHRDLKPGNILVSLHDVTPVVKIIDFGISKAIGQQLTDKTVYTGIAQLVGTPLYMSPEQAGLSNLDVDTRSDIYALGVVLYELLTGTTPFESEMLKKASYDEMRRMIREDEPPRPSTRLSTLDAAKLSTICERRNMGPRKLSSEVRGELDWIVMKALEKDRNRRYETAGALAADVERYLRDEAVEACPPSRHYRLGKFLCRHRTGVLVATALLVAVLALVGSGGLLLGDRAVRLATSGRKIDVALAGARTAIEAGKLTLARQRIGEARLHLELEGDSLPAQVAETDKVHKEIEAREADETRFLQFLKLANDAQDKMGYLDRGDDVLVIGTSVGQDKIDYLETADILGGDALAKEALDLYGVLAADDWLTRLDHSFLSADQKDQVREMIYVTLVSLATDFRLRWQIGHPNVVESSLDLLRRAAAFHEPTPAWYFVRSEYYRLRGNKAAAAEDVKRFQEGTARTAFDHYLPGHAAGARGDLQKAIRAYRKALDLQPNHYNSLFYLAVRFQTDEINRLPEAIELYTGCSALRPDHIFTYLSRAECHQKLGQLEDAESAYSAAIAASKIQSDRAFAYTQRQAFYQGLTMTDKAREDGKRAAALYEQFLQKPKAKLDRETLVAMHNLAYLYCGASELRKGIELYEQVLEKRKDILGLHNPDTLASLYGLAAAYHQVGRRHDAEVLLERASEELKAKLGPDHRDTLQSMHNLAYQYGQMGRWQDAIALHEQTLAKRRAKLGPDHPDTLESINNLAHGYSVVGRRQEAIALFEQRSGKLKAKLGPDHPDTLESIDDLAYEYGLAGRWPEAIMLREYILEKRKTKLGPDAPDTLRSMNRLAVAYGQAGRLPDAIALHQQTLEKSKAKLGTDHADTLQCMINLAHEYGLAGRWQEAVGLCEQLLEKRKASLGPDHGQTLHIQFQLAHAYQQAAELDLADRLFRELLERERKKQGTQVMHTDGLLASLGLNLLKQQRHTEAEAILRECLANREKQQPGNWQRFNALSMLGGALLGQRKYAEAEPLLLQGYEGMQQHENKIPSDAKARMGEAIERIVHLYEATEQQEKARTWREKLPAGNRPPD